MSGLPYVTASVAVSGSVFRIDFPYLTKNVVVKNIGPNTLAVGFTQSGTLGSNRLTLPTGTAFSMDFRIISLYLTALSSSCSYEVVAGLTTVRTRDFPTLTGSAPIVSASVFTPYFSYDGIG